MSWTRREFLRAGSLTALGAGLNLVKPDILVDTALGERVAPAPDTKMIFIFQRGGCDAVNTVIPYGDSEYKRANRPTLFIPRASAIDLGNDFAGLHPRMAAMMEIYNHPALTGVDGTDRSRRAGQSGDNPPRRLRRAIQIPLQQQAVLGERRARRSVVRGRHDLPPSRLDDESAREQPGRRGYVQFADGGAQRSPAGSDHRQRRDVPTAADFWERTAARETSRTSRTETSYTARVWRLPTR